MSTANDRIDRRRARSSLLVWIALALACRGGDHRGAADEMARSLAAVLAAADQARAPWRCTGDDLPVATDVQLAATAGRWELQGHTLRLRDRSDATTIAVIADAGGSAPATLAAFARLRTKLADTRLDLVIALGGMGFSTAELEATLGALIVGGNVPVVALPGDLEAMPEHVTALARLRQHGATVLDGRLVHVIELPGATIATIPGAGSAERLVAGGDGCAWKAEDVVKIYAELATRPGLRIAATAESPRVTLAGEPTGERALAPPSGSVDIVLHGPTREAPTAPRNGTRDGHAVALSPGTSDATPRLPDPHQPSLGLLVLRDSTWSWRPVQ
jgi:hypothetical protein